MRISPRITSKPAAASETRKNAVGMVPITGAIMRMNRKLAPQIAASDSKRTISTGLTVHSFLYRGGSVAESPDDGNRKSGIKLMRRVRLAGAGASAMWRRRDQGGCLLTW